MDSHCTTNGQKTVEYSTFYDILQIITSLQLDYPRNVIRNEVSLLNFLIDQHMHKFIKYTKTLSLH
jgi:hypothetical protein